PLSHRGRRARPEVGVRPGADVGLNGRYRRTERTSCKPRARRRAMNDVVTTADVGERRDAKRKDEKNRDGHESLPVQRVHRFAARIPPPWSEVPATKPRTSWAKWPDCRGEASVP